MLTPLDNPRIIPFSGINKNLIRSLPHLRSTGGEL